MVWKQGTGERKLVVFADPNCGYCKKFEKRPAGGQGRHRLHLPVSDPGRRFAREVEGDLVRQGQHQDLARLDDQGNADPATAASATPRRSSATTRSAALSHQRHAGPGVRGRPQAGRRAQHRADRKAARRQPPEEPELSAVPARPPLHAVARVLAVDQPLQGRERVLAGAVLRIELERVGDALLEHGARDRRSPRPSPASPAASRRRG